MDVIPYPLSGKGLCGAAGLPRPTSCPKSGSTMISEEHFPREMPVASHSSCHFYLRVWICNGAACPFPPAGPSHQGTMQGTSTEKLLWTDYFFFLSQHLQNRETLIEVFKKLCLLAVGLSSRLKDSLNTIEEKQ